MSSWEKTLPKRGKVKRSDKSALAQAEKSYSPQEPKKLTHITTTRLKGPTGRNRKPPSRKPMVERTTKLTIDTSTEDVSLVANKPAESRPALDEKTKEIKEIETQRKKSLVGKVEGKIMIRVFLDNNGISFKTVAIQKDTTIHELAGLVAKKIFDDTTGFGIWEVKDKLDVELIDPRETASEIMDSWKESQLYKFVYKKAHGEKAKLYFKKPPTATTRASTNSPLGKAPLPAIQKRESQPIPMSTPKELMQKPVKPAKPGPPSKLVPAQKEKEPEPEPEPEPELEPEPEPEPEPESKPIPDVGRGRPLGGNDHGRGVARGAVRGSPRAMPRGRGARGGVRGGPPPGRGAGSPRAAPRRGARGAPARGRLTPDRPASSPSEPQVPSKNLPPASLSEGNPVQTNEPEPTETKPLPVEPSPPAVEPVPEATVEEPKEEPQEPESDATKHITEWSIEEVADWIESLGFGSVRSIFVENYISGAELVDLTNEELKEDLGVAALGARKAILRQIQQLNT